MYNHIPTSVNNGTEFAKKFTFCTLVTNLDKYQEMMQRAKNKDFVGDDVEYIYFDNRQGNVFDDLSGIHHAMRHAQGKHLIFYHQDILFIDDDRIHLEKSLHQLEIKNHLCVALSNARETI